MKRLHIGANNTRQVKVIKLRLKITYYGGNVWSRSKRYTECGSGWHCYTSVFFNRTLVIMAFVIKVYIYIYIYIYVCKLLKLFSIKLAGITAIVIHYFVISLLWTYVISNKHYFVLHLFSDSITTPICCILYLLLHLSKPILFYLLVVGWASRSFKLFIALWLPV